MNTSKNIRRVFRNFYGVYCFIKDIDEMTKKEIYDIMKKFSKSLAMPKRWTLLFW